MNNLPTVTKNLLIINVLCFFGMFVARKYGVDIENMLGLHFFLASDFNLGQLMPISRISSSICLRYGCSDGCWNRCGDLNAS